MVNLTAKIGEREFKYRGLTLIERAPIKDAIEFKILEYVKRVNNDWTEAATVAVGLELSIKLVKMATELKDSEINELDELTVKELAAHILNETYLSKTEKKS
jgi:hypothetical protein